LGFLNPIKKEREKVKNELRLAGPPLQIGGERSGTLSNVRN